MHLEAIQALDAPEAADARPVGSRLQNRLPLDRAELVADNWSSKLEVGFRLYRLFPDRSLYGLVRYDRQVDGKTGEMVEEEHLVKYGFAKVESVYVPDSEELGEEREQNKFGIEDGSTPDVTQKFGILASGVGAIRSAYQQFGRDAIEENLHDAVSPLEIFGEYVAYAEPEGVFGAMIEYDEPNPNNADQRREIARTFAAELHPEGTPEGDDAVYYIGRLEFTDVPEWYLRATELHLNGVLKNRPTVALVQAMSESDNPRFETQEDIASSLGLNQSTVSKHLSTGEEWRDRASWHAENG